MQYWDRKAIIDMVQSYAQLAEINESTLEKIEDEIMVDNFLRRSSWHHIGHKPIWFYSASNAVLNGIVDKDMLQRMKADSRKYNVKYNKPRLTYVNVYQWGKSMIGNHQKADIVPYIAVVYQGYAYFMNGKRRKLERGVVEEGNPCGKIVGNNRKKFEKIVRLARKNYGLKI